MKKWQYYRVLDDALSTAKRHDVTPDEFYYMLDGIKFCAQQDYDITPEDFVEIIEYKDKIAGEIGK